MRALAEALPAGVLRVSRRGLVTLRWAVRAVRVRPCEPVGCGRHAERLRPCVTGWVRLEVQRGCGLGITGGYGVACVGVQRGCGLAERMQPRLDGVTPVSAATLEPSARCHRSCDNLTHTGSSP